MYVNNISIFNLDDINIINPNQIFILDHHEKSNKIFKVCWFVMMLLYIYDSICIGAASDCILHIG